MFPIRPIQNINKFSTTAVIITTSCVAVFLCILSITASPTLDPEFSYIAKSIVQDIDQMDSDEILAAMKRHYVLLGLMDRDGLWLSPALSDIQDELLPPKTDKDDLRDFVMTMADAAQSNEYVSQFVKDMYAQNNVSFNMTFTESTNGNIPDAVAYAFVLEKITHSAIEDPEIIKVLVSLLQNTAVERQTQGIFNESHQYKLMLIEQSMQKYAAIHSGVMPLDENFMRQGVPTNIRWATEEDAAAGAHSNAYVGTVLEYYSENNSVAFSPDKRTINIDIPNVGPWNDLYASWNMAFISRYPEFLYLMSKLLIPSVASKEHEPGSYIYRRSIALYVASYHLQFLRASEDSRLYSWNMPELTRAWGEANHRYAQDYIRQTETKSQK